MTIATGLMTARELERLSGREGRIELVRGVLIEMPPAGHIHGEHAANCLIDLGSFVRRHRLGRIYAAETGFVLFRDPDTVRAPDVAFVTEERARSQLRRRGFFEGAPDLAVEIQSPDETAAELDEKARDYLAAGARLVWCGHPAHRTVTVHAPGVAPRVLGPQDVLDGDDVLPGFCAVVGDLFADV